MISSGLTWRSSSTSLLLISPGTSSLICVFVVVDRFYIALFSALEQTHCARMWFFSFLFYIHRSGVLTALAWLVPRETAAISARSVYTMHHVTSCKATYVRCMRINFSCNLPLALLAEWPGSFTCYCGNTGVERIPKYESAQKVDPGEWEKNSPAAPAGFRTHDLSIMSPAV